MAHIIMIPRMPDDMALDFLFRTDAAIAVQASDEEIEAIKQQGIAVIDLYASGNEYAAAMYNLTEDQALAAIDSIKNTALAALTPTERNQFGVA